MVCRHGQSRLDPGGATFIGGGKDVLTQQSHIEQVVGSGNLASLNSEERVAYYTRTCETLGLNPVTRPLEFMVFQGKTVLYVRKDACEQLRKLHSISIQIVERVVEDGVLTVVARATTPEGRSDEEIGSVSVAGLKGEALANANMKALTKAKRRATLSICGLGYLDETDTESLPVPSEVVPIAFEPQVGSGPLAHYASLAAKARASGLAHEVVSLTDDAPVEFIRAEYKRLKRLVDDVD